MEILHYFNGHHARQNNALLVIIFGIVLQSASFADSCILETWFTYRFFDLPNIGLKCFLHQVV